VVIENIDAAEDCGIDLLYHMSAAQNYCGRFSFINIY